MEKIVAKINHKLGLDNADIHVNYRGNMIQLDEDVAELMNTADDWELRARYVNMSSV